MKQSEVLLWVKLITAKNSLFSLQVVFSILKSPSLQFSLTEQHTFPSSALATQDSFSQSRTVNT